MIHCYNARLPSKPKAVAIAGWMCVKKSIVKAVTKLETALDTTRFSNLY
jgi:hypothetical protein